MNQNTNQKGRLYEDEQIVSSDCCNAFIRITSSTSIDKLIKSQKSLRTSKEKGIQLTHKTKSYTKIATLSQLVYKQSQPLKLNQKVLKKQQISPSQSNLIVGEQNQKKSFFVKKCIDYKNKKIQQHKNETMEQISLKLQLSRKQELCSTMRNTARTKNSSSFGALVLDKRNNSYNNISIQHSYIENGKEEQKHIQSQPISFVNKSPRKTLQKVFEQTQGRRIITLQSQISSEDNSCQYSQAESYDFPYTHS